MRKTASIFFLLIVISFVTNAEDKIEEKTSAGVETMVIDSGKTESESASKLDQDGENKQLFDILSRFKLQSNTLKRTTYDVSIPAAAAGIRGAGIKNGNRFSPIWPKSDILPLEALSRVLKQAHAHGESWTNLNKILIDFSENYAEFKENKSYKELSDFFESQSK